MDEQWEQPAAKILRMSRPYELDGTVRNVPTEWTAKPNAVGHLVAPSLTDVHKPARRT
jgi:hypothetical protein